MAAKRFTDTGKWGKASFDRLSDRMKLVWIYLCDNCDHAGIWDINWRLMGYHLNAPPHELEKEVAQELKDKIEFLSDSKLFLPAFVDFQYGELNPENRVHLSVINRLKKEGAYKGLTSPMERAKDKDKEKDKDKDKDSLEKGCGEKPFRPDLEFLYRQYPRKEGRARGLAILKGSVKTPHDFLECQVALGNFLEHHKRKGTEAKFIPHFKTWANSWRDCLDPDYGKSEGFSANPTGKSDAEYEAEERAIFEKAGNQ